MKKLNSLKDYSFDNTEISEEIKKGNQMNNKFDKVLCNHCGRTANNGIRCLGICVADNDY